MRVTKRRMRCCANHIRKGQGEALEIDRMKNTRFIMIKIYIQHFSCEQQSFIFLYHLSHPTSPVDLLLSDSLYLTRVLALLLMPRRWGFATRIEPIQEAKLFIRTSSCSPILRRYERFSYNKLCGARKRGLSAKKGMIASKIEFTAYFMLQYQPNTR